MKAGLIVQACQAFIIQATFFVLPLYLQIVLGFDALQTGKTILPLSVALFVFALGGASMTSRFGAKLIVQRGLAALLVGEVVLLYFLGPDLATVGFAIGMALIGAGLGLMASQVGNVIMSSVDSSRGSEAGGLQGTSLNLGASLGVALVGSIVIGLLATNFTTIVSNNPNLPDSVKQQVAVAAEKSANFVSASQVESAAVEAGLTADADHRARRRLLRGPARRAARGPRVPRAVRAARAGVGATSCPRDRKVAVARRSA